MKLTLKTKELLFFVAFMTRFRIILLLLLGNIPFSIRAQAYRDQLRAKNERHIMCDTVPQLADSVFSAIKTLRFDSLEVYTPSYNQLKATFDTLKLTENDQFVLIKQQYLVHHLYKQLKTLQVVAKRNKINLKYMELKSTDIRYGTHKDGYPFAIVTLKCARNNKKFHISFVAMQILNHWYIADELKLTPEEKIPKLK